MSGAKVVVLQIDDSSDKTVTGAIQYDRTNGGRLVVPSGTSFPTTGVLPGELFFRTDTQQIYRRNDADTAWELFADGTATTTPLASTAPANVTKSAAAVGVGTTAARADHKHDISTAAPGATGVATSSGEGTATTLARSDHTHQANTAPVNVTKAAAAIGTSGQPARADHKHDVTTAAAVAITDSTNAEGSATSLARSDHQHSHGARGGGTLHATATTSVAGFLSAADKTKLDALFDYSDYTEDEGTDTETGATFATATSLAFTAPAAGTYQISWQFEVKNQTLNGISRTRVQLDGADQAFADVPTAIDLTMEFPISGFREVVLTAGAHTLNIDHFPFTGSGSQVRRRRLRVERVA